MSDDAKAKRKMRKVPVLNSTDAVAILTCWAGAAAVARLSASPIVEMIAIAAAYYLSKWVILKVEK